MVLETKEQLQTLLDRFAASPYESRVRLLLAIKEDPRIKSEALMGSLGLSDRTIRRWWSEYHRSGLAGFLESRTSDVTVPAVAEDTVNYEDAGARALMDFLNSLPLTCDMAEWRDAVEAALARYLTGIDAVEVLVPAVEALAPRPRSTSSATAHSDSQVRELNVGDNGSLGRLRLHILQGYAFEPALVQLEELGPFLTFLLSDGAARVQSLHIEQDAEGGDTLSGPLVKSLTARERDVLLHRLYGYSYAESAERLGVSEATIRKCVKNIYRKTDTSSMGELFVRYFSSLDPP